jgi:hypothetical protein
MSEANFLAGAATRRITPTLERGPVYLAGFQQNRRASGIDLDLYVRAIGLRLDDHAVALVAVDLIGLSLPDVEEIRARLAASDIDPQGLIVACTHTHSAPDTLGLWGPEPGASGSNPGYMALVKQAVVDAAVEALTFCCPAQIRAATTRLPGYVQNLRAPDLIDDEVAALQFVKPDGEVVATLLNLACHPEVLDGQSALISSDYAGAACVAVEAAIGGMALHISGALGGMLSPAVPERTPEGLRRMGRAYAEAALAALAGAPLVAAERLELRRARFVLPQQNPLFHAALGSGVLRERAVVAGALETECAYLDLGPAQILSIPGELLPRLGAELKAAMPGPCRVLAGIADDELGYILPDDEFVTPADYANPGAQYEESMSLGPAPGSLVMRAALDLIRG